MPRSTSIAKLLATVGVLLIAACGGRTAPPASTPTPRAQAGRPASSGLEFDATRLYTQMGFLATGSPMPFVGAVSYLATATPDSTDMTVGVSLANYALSFARDNDRFVAGYTVSITVRQGGATIRDFNAHESVRVASYKEVSRIDESVVFQQGMSVPPGRYTLAVSVRDDGTGRNAAQEMAITVPRLGAAGSLSTPVPFLKVTPRKTLATVAELVTNPRATAVFGRDTTVALYLEGYGTGDRLPLSLQARNDAGRILWNDSVSLPRHGGLFSGVIYVPVSRIGIGASLIDVWPTGMPDSVHTPVFVGFGEGLPVARYEDMLQYLRWFAASWRLKTLRDTTPEARPAAWAAFVKATDPSPETTVNEDLIGYFGRLMDVTARFREEGMPGWMTDRGKVLLGLGEPDQVYDQGLAGYGERGRSQIWEYRRLNIQLVFYDQTGFGRWRLTNSSEMEFQSQWQRVVNR